MAVRLYVGAVALVATAVGVLAAIMVPAAGHLSPVTLFVIGATMALAQLLQVRYMHADEVEALTLIEGVAAPLIFFGSGLEVVVVTAIGVGAHAVFATRDRMKALFNVTQWTLSIAAGSLALHAMRDGGVHGQAELVALVVAVVVATFVNGLAMAGVLALVTGSVTGRRDRRDTRAFVIGHVISTLVNVTCAVTLTAAFRWSPWTLLLGVVLVVASHLGGQASAEARIDRLRLEAMQRATHALAAGLDPAGALPSFLSEVRFGFDVAESTLALFDDGTTTAHSVRAVDDGAYDGHYTITAGSHALADVLSHTITGPARFVVGTGDEAISDALREQGHHRCLAAPLRSGDATIGMLILYDRVGMEGFEEGELSVAAALARELVGFLERVQLLAEIDGERRKLTEILESTSDGILTIDADGVITSWNAGLAAITGHAAGEMLGTRHFGLLRARDAAGRDVMIERWQEMLDSPGGLPQELQIVSAEGESIWLSCSYSRIAATEGRGDTLVIVARNITQARELERLKDDFIAVVSHELRTPLVPIKGWAQTLINRGDRLTDAQRRTAVQSILAQAQKLESLVLNILEASRIESGRGEGDGVADVAAVTMRIVEDTLAARPDRVLRVRPPSVPCEVRGSSVWVERAVSNLVSNALKYSPDDEPIDVAVFTEAGEVVVSVTDRGPGIAADAHDRIFERFERLEESRTQTGTGLGLYITRRLARAMGGDVTVSSVPGAGSTFLLRMPAAPVTRMRDAPAVPEQRRIGRSDDDTVVNLR